MNNAISLVLHLLSSIGKPINPGSSKTIITGYLLLIQQLLVHTRSTWVSDWTRIKTLFDESSMRNTDLTQETTDSPGSLTSVMQRVVCGVTTCSTLSTFGSGADHVTSLNSFRGESCCRGLFQLPVAA